MIKYKFFNINSYGIQNRFLKYVMILLTISYLILSICIGIVATSNLKNGKVKEAEYINDKLVLALGNRYTRIDDNIGKCIISSNFQKSLLNRDITLGEKEELYRELANINIANLDEYLYVDNKGNVYSKSYRNINYKKFSDSNFNVALGNEYSKTKFIWQQDNLFSTNSKSLFICRFIRNMNFSHEPGILLFKMNNSFFEDILKEVINEGSNVYFFVNIDGEICYEKNQGNSRISDESRKKISMHVNELMNGTSIENSNQIYSVKEGTVAYKYHDKTGLIIANLIPNSIIYSTNIKIVWIVGIVFLIMLFTAFNFSIYFSKRFTKPIKDINEAMISFKGDDFSKKLSINTNTELDTIGESYNKMIINIKNLLDEVKKQEKELRISELNSLMYQINPHFLYNILDNIYMLARINKEESTMKMIQALSNFFKIGLSNGSDTISVAKEIEHVTSYMEIQKIRNDNLFTYEVHCEDKVNYYSIIKLILQPIVENSIKHGFSEMYEGGIIEINIYEKEKNIIFTIYNNGNNMTEEMLDELNSMPYLSFDIIKEKIVNKRNGYGIANVISRLKLKYGDNIEFYYTNEKVGVTCTIIVPKISNGGS